MSWLMDRLSEPSTWRGIIAIAASAGVTVSPEHAVTIASVAACVVGAINVVRKETVKNQPPQKE